MTFFLLLFEHLFHLKISTVIIVLFQNHRFKKHHITSFKTATLKWPYQNGNSDRPLMSFCRELLQAHVMPTFGHESKKSMIHTQSSNG